MVYICFLLFVFSLMVYTSACCGKWLHTQNLTQIQKKFGLIWAVRSCTSFWLLSLMRLMATVDPHCTSPSPVMRVFVVCVWCMFVCVCTRECGHACVRVCVCACMRKHACVCVHVCVCVHACMCVCNELSVSLCLCKCSGLLQNVAP